MHNVLEKDLGQGLKLGTQNWQFKIFGGVLFLKGDHKNVFSPYNNAYHAY